MPETKDYPEYTPLNKPDKNLNKVFTNLKVNQSNIFIQDFEGQHSLQLNKDWKMVCYKIDGPIDKMIYLCNL